MSMKKRVGRLEEAARGGRKCPECGDSPPSPKLIAVYADDTPEELRFFPDPEIPEGEPFCPECGRQQYLILTIVYDR
jgi:ribosomal protein S27AE